ncbi:MAG: hypothetical protein ACI9T7_000928 [Oleiphilaceae bacterium]|jgi:hypothetical protein
MNNIVIDRVLNATLDALKTTLLQRVGVDQKICTLTITAGKVDVPQKKEWKREALDSTNFNNKIIILMESPHDDEFDKSNKFIGPANGGTGEKISMHLSAAINIIHDISPIENGDYDLVLMNAVSFQCSMGFSTGYFRDLTFIGLWFDGGERNFIKRLNNFSLTKKDIIISSCTAGSHKYFKQTLGRKRFDEATLREICQNNKIKYSCNIGLRGLVDNAIHRAKIDARVVKCIHPCGWKADNILRDCT